jgi:hypothetical protein
VKLKIIKSSQNRKEKNEEKGPNLKYQKMKNLYSMMQLKNNKILTKEPMTQI